MYQQYAEAKKAPEMLSTFMGLNDLHMKYFHEMYLDTCQALTARGTAEILPHISPTLVSPHIPPTSVSPHIPTTSVSTDASGSNIMLSPLLLSPTSSCSYSSSSSSPVRENMFTGTLQQQKLLALHHQYLTAAAMVQHQLAMTAIPRGNPLNACRTPPASHPDEISKSLKMFAMLTAYNTNGHEPTVAVSSQLPQFSSVDAVMQDFAGNGYITDEINRSQIGMRIKNTPNIGRNTAIPGANTTSVLTSAANQRRQLQQHNNVNLNFNNNFLKAMPANMQQPSYATTTAGSGTAAASANINYNCNKKRLSKRYNGVRNDKYLSSKHCVFCENNNEPDAVVKSHSVRDSMGRVLCPKLRTYICPICRASGDKAHTIKYCPQKPIITMDDAVKAESFRLTKNTYYKPQMKV